MREGGGLQGTSGVPIGANRELTSGGVGDGQRQKQNKNNNVDPPPLLVSRFVLGCYMWPGDESTRLLFRNRVDVARPNPATSHLGAISCPLMFANLRGNGVRECALSSCQADTHSPLIPLYPQTRLFTLEIYWCHREISETVKSH